MSRRRCWICRGKIQTDDYQSGYGMCGECLHDALRSGWEPVT